MAREEGADGLSTERTSLAWGRTGLAFATAAAITLRFLDADLLARVVLAVGLGAVGLGAWLWGRAGSHGRPAIDSPAGRAVVHAVAIATALLGVAGAAAQLA